VTRTRLAIVLPALVVAVGAVVATAHGLFAVAVATGGMPEAIAWLYPLITDGLALVAYAASHQLPSKRGYAWSVVVLAAGLSGLAQAVFLAGDGTTVQVPSALRFGMGFWPAIAGLIGGHLVWLLVRGEEDTAPAVELVAEQDDDVEDLVEFEDEAATVQEMLDRRGVLSVVPQPSRAGELIAAGVGRRRLARELDITESEARRLLDAAKEVARA
jgi:hypothetical protein